VLQSCKTIECMSLIMVLLFLLHPNFTYDSQSFTSKEYSRASLWYILAQQTQNIPRHNISIFQNSTQTTCYASIATLFEKQKPAVYMFLYIVYNLLLVYLVFALTITVLFYNFFFAIAYWWNVSRVHTLNPWTKYSTTWWVITYANSFVFYCLINAI